MRKFKGYCNIGLVLLSSDFRVIGVNSYARKALGSAISELGKSVFHYHHRKSRLKIEYLLRRSSGQESDMPVAMIVDVLNKVLMINVCNIEMKEESTDPLFAMTFIDVTEQTGAEVNPRSGMVELKKFPVCCRDSFLFLDASSIYYIQSDGNYCRVFTEKSSYYLHLTLKNILSRYTGSSFLRVHKSFIANLDHVQKIKRVNKGQTVIIFDREDIPPVPVARRRISDLKKALPLV